MKKIVIGSLIVLVVAASFLLIFFNVLINKSFPVLEGNINVDGLKSKTEIVRDGYGIPYIQAENEADLFFTMGYVHAQDRLWQMDILRRAGEGRLSEILGSKTLDIDIMFKTMQVEEASRIIYENCSEETKNILKNYSDGINSFIQEKERSFQIEFDVLNYKPELWKPYQSIVISRVFAWQLNIGWWADLTFEKLKEKLSPDKFVKLKPGFPRLNTSEDISGNISRDEQTNDFLTYFEEGNKKFRDFFKNEGLTGGSNCWVISGKRSASGKPVLANDPHLNYTQPSVWYAASLSAPGYNVSGVTIPGSPVVVIGKNNYLAWGMTNLMLDDCDFFIEQANMKNKSYQENGAEKKLLTVADTVFIKNGDPVIFEKYKTQRGPLLFNLKTKFYKGTNSKYYSVKWTGLEQSDEILTFYKINKSKSYHEFNDALKTFGLPAQNFICADISGNIFYKAAGKIPVRNREDAVLPSGKNTDWNGFVTFEALPSSLNPEKNYLATCNNPPDQPTDFYIGDFWEPSSRYERINELLSSKEKYSSEDFKKFQNDVVSPHAGKFADAIIAAFSGIDIKDNNLKKTLRYFENWDCSMDKSSQVSAIYSVFYNKLLVNVFRDEMGEKLFNDFVMVGNIPHRIILNLITEKEFDNVPPVQDTILHSSRSEGSWFDDVGTAEKETKTILIRKSLVQAIEWLEAEFGKKPEDWQWRKLHTVSFKHLFSGESEITDKVFDTDTFPVSGDQTTLNNTSYPLCSSWSNTIGPSMRIITDLGNIDRSDFILTTGQSGHINHSNYSDQTIKWLNGEYIYIFNNGKNSEHKNILTLHPAR